MMQVSNDKVDSFLGGLFEVIGYEGDKDAVIKDFILACQRTALADLIQALSPEQLARFNSALGQDTNPDAVANVIGSFFPPDAYSAAVETATKHVFEDYLDSILPALDATRQQRLREYLAAQSARPTGQ